MRHVLKIYLIGKEHELDFTVDFDIAGEREEKLTNDLVEVRSFIRNYLDSDCQVLKIKHVAINRAAITHVVHYSR